ncbi:epimerase [Micromonospora sp. NPDC047738]|uniref:epimerase n=1 Tax=Micromonospora sp. NPDC047738 TaxID=3155741 RepID=UPI0034044EE5
MAGMTRTAAKAELVQALGAQPVLCDVYDAAALTTATSYFRPDLILHELTELPDTVEELPVRRTDNPHIRIAGTRNLIAAATAADCGRLFAQSVAWELPPCNGANTVRALEDAVLGSGGVVLRYGQSYGPGTFYPNVPPVGPPIHIDAAAERTIVALNRPTGILTITDNTATSD